MLDALIGAGTSLLGGLFGSSSAKKQQQRELAAQREFAQHGIRWKVEDAKQAGIHPVYALGAQTHSYTPQQVGGDPFPSALAQAGQDIGRAIDAKRTHNERDAAYARQLAALTLQRAGLENELLGAQIAKIRQPAAPPALPGVTDRFLIDGQGETHQPLVADNPLERVASDPVAPNLEPGAINETGFVRTPTGWAPVQSEDAKQRLEEDWVGSAAWQMRNRLAPSLGFRMQPPPGVPLKEGHEWGYDFVNQEYVQVPKENRRKIGW